MLFKDFLFEHPILVLIYVGVLGIGLGYLSYLEFKSNE
jgi:hypothetical protein